MKNIDEQQYDPSINWKPGELEDIVHRASHLSVEELKELTEYVGIMFTAIDEDELMLKEEYLDVLDEADSKEKVFKYLKDKGV